MLARSSHSSFWFIAPAMLCLLLFFFLPVAAGWMLSFTDFDLYALADPAQVRFIGLENYRRLVNDPEFWIALRNTLYFVAIGGPLSVLVSLLAALLLDHHLTPWKAGFRTVLFLPVVTTLVAVAVVWRYLYHPRHGVLNQVLGWLRIEPVDWLGDPDWALPAIILMAVWKNFGLNMIIFLAGLQGIPVSLYEAARIDGVSAWQQFWYITLPSLESTLRVVVLITMIGYFQWFAEPYIMTGGGPARQTLSIAFLMYEQGFRWWNLGYAAAAAFVLFALIGGGSWLLGRFLRPAGERAGG
jgi:multiple sugar transport system permease protein